MKASTRNLARLPGWIASALMVFFCVFWTYWGANEMYHEGWWGAWTNRVAYLAPIALTLVPTLIAFRWPLAGGGIILAVGVFAFFFFSSDVSFIGLGIALVGAAFIGDGILKRKVLREAETPRTPGWRRRLWTWIALGAPAIVFAVTSAFMLPVVLTRVDDGDRGARTIAADSATLVWAPDGPGWNWKQPWGGYPSWQSIALYGVAPVGLGEKPGYGRQGAGQGTTVYATAADMARTNLCRYLSADGATLLDTPQDIWRMPTTAEVVQALGRHGENAGCRWQGEFARQVACTVRPDKESPLWATDHPAIYYWTADSYTADRGTYVAYNGAVNASNKLGGNPRNSYRCVREP